MIKKIVKKILNGLGYQIKKYDLNKTFIDKSDWIPFKNIGENFKLYNSALKKSENQSTDNFSKQLRFYSLIQIVKKILNKEEIFDFVECGCWKGHSSFIISKLIKDSKKKINFHIFDSFEGLSDSTIEDKDFHLKNTETKNKISKHFSSSESFVKNKVLNDFNFVHTYKGWIPNKFKEIENKNFSFVHLDVDLYQPTYDSLKFFFPKLVSGGAIVCDDYNSSHFPGAKEAWDKYFIDKKFDFFYENPFGGCFLIK